jgi:hypothetical protein
MSSATHNPAGGTLADESFMSADDFRAYMTELEMAKASKMVGAMDQGRGAREEARRHAEQNEIAVSPEKIAEIKNSLANKTRAAAGRGEKEVLVMRFPSALCTDRGRAINNAEAGLAGDADRKTAASLRVLEGASAARQVQAARHDHRLARRAAGRRRVLSELVIAANGGRR